MKITATEPTLQTHREAGVEFYLLPTADGVEVVVCRGVEMPYTVQSLGEGKMRVTEVLVGSECAAVARDFDSWSQAASFIANTLREAGCHSLVA